MELSLERWGQISKEEASALQSIVLDSWVWALESGHAHSGHVVQIGEERLFASLGNLSQEDEAHALLFPLCAFDGRLNEGGSA